MVIVASAPGRRVSPKHAEARCRPLSLCFPCEKLASCVVGQEAQQAQRQATQSKRQAEEATAARAAAEAAAADAASQVAALQERLASADALLVRIGGDSSKPVFLRTCCPLGRAFLHLLVGALLVQIWDDTTRLL